MEPQPPAAAANLIQLADVEVVEGPEGVIGQGALGVVRRGRIGDADVALKT